MHFLFAQLHYLSITGLGRLHGIRERKAALEFAPVLVQAGSLLMAT
jgi:hypothetical protein